MVRDADESFQVTYEPMLFAVAAFLLAIHLMVLGTVTGVIPPVRSVLGRATIVLFGLLMVSVGNLLPRTRPNLAFGVRTRRTLADRAVWMRTNRAAGNLAVALGLVLIVAGAFLPGDLMRHVLAWSALATATLFVIALRRSTSTAQKV
jgi:uncharacterized membrane protein